MATGMSTTKMWPAPLHEALWGEYRNWQKYFIAIYTIFHTFWCKKIITLQYSNQKLQNVENGQYDIHSKQLSEIGAVNDFKLYVLLWANEDANVP